MLLFFTSTLWLDRAATIIATFGHLYMSSANLTGGQSATTADAARRAFGDEVIVLDGDPWRDQTRPQGSTTMVALTRDGDLTVARPGINSAAFGQDQDAYAAELSRRWRATSQEAER
jgi:L-threonylcarbamoyladenylate synthase